MFFTVSPHILRVLSICNLGSFNNRRFYTALDFSAQIRQIESARKIAGEVIAYTKNNPNYDALDIRRKLYESMRAHFVPFIFTESPFYFEAGVNGGWAGTRPARKAWQLCSRFYKEKNLIPEEAFKVFRARNRTRLTLCCGPFVDSIHHIPPTRTILSKGFAAFIRRLKTR